MTASQPDDRRASICKRFRADWEAALAGGPRPRVEDVLADAHPEDQVELLIELMGVESEYQRQLGDTANGTATAEHPHLGQLAEPLEPASMQSGERLDPLPTAVGGYRVMGLLGEGGMGQVLRAADDRLGREVAIKVMRPDVARDRTSRQRFFREARAAAALQHDNVVPIYQVGEENGSPFIAMPLLAGESLHTYLKAHGPLSEPEVMRLGRETAHGLAAAHAAGLVHRDIKPANLWLEAPAGRVKILDFGLARSLKTEDGISRFGTILGTPAYMAPEQINAEEVDARADLFSLGCVLYQAATGKMAFEAPTLTALLRAVAERQPPEPRAIVPTVSPELSALIMRLLAKDAAGRPQTAQAVVAELEQLGKSPAEKRDQTVVLPQLPRNRRLAWTIAAVGGLVALLLVGVGMWWRNSEPTVGERPESAERKEEIVVPPQPQVVGLRGKLDVLIEREVEPKMHRLVRLYDPRALPLRKTDKFRVEAETDAPAYMYIIWVDPKKDVTPVYPWNPEKGWGTRPKKEVPTRRLVLPPAAGNLYRAPNAQPGIATMVLLARSTPLDVPDDKVREAFEALPDLPQNSGGGEKAAAWFDNYTLVTNDPYRTRTFQITETDDPFARWQGQLQGALGKQVECQSAVSFARVGAR